MIVELQHAPGGVRPFEVRSERDRKEVFNGWIC